jgi:hypothetical protein
MRGLNRPSLCHRENPEISRRTSDKIAPGNEIVGRAPLPHESIGESPCNICGARPSGDRAPMVTSNAMISNNAGLFSRLPEAGRQNSRLSGYLPRFIDKTARYGASRGAQGIIFDHIVFVGGCARSLRWSGAVCFAPPRAITSTQRELRRANTCRKVAAMARRRGAPTSLGAHRSTPGKAGDLRRSHAPRGARE